MASLPPLLVDLPRNPIVAVGLPVALGIGTGLLTKNAKNGPNSANYKALKKPSIDPPKWAFGVVWPILYAAMGYSSHLIVKSLDRTPPGLGRRTAGRALQLYYAQLALNQLWTPLNFGLGQRFLALLDLSALTVTLGYWLSDLEHVEHRAFLLNLPYLAWSLYATALNAGLWWLNGGQDTVKGIWAKVKGGVGEIAGKKKGQ